MPLLLQDYFNYMLTEYYPFEQVPQLSRFDVAYQNEIEALKPFYKYSKQIETIKDIIKNKDFDTEKRNILYSVLTEQYNHINVSEILRKNIDSLKTENTYTVTTAHQPMLFGGPLYFIYKICSTINLSVQLNKNFPDFHFVPVYWMGEDHDFEEINHLFLFGKKIIWDDYQGGTVANYHCGNLKKTIGELFEILGDSINAKELKEIISESFSAGYSYGEATFRFVNSLFSKFGLVILQPENKDLKKIMIPIFEEELLQNSSFGLVNETVSHLEKIGFSNQAFVRPVNLFYSIPGKRLRIEKNDGYFQVLNSEIKFSEKEIKEELYNHPERFSPNVVLRPLFQESILPNVAFVGGGGEIAYWLERKVQFEHYKVPYPMILRRNSLMYLDTVTVAKMEKLNINFMDILLDTDKLIRKYLTSLKNDNLDFESEKKELEKIFSLIAKKVKETDQTIESVVIAQLHQTITSIEKLETKVLKIEKQKQETGINQLRKIQEKLYLPANLQERKENFMGLYLKYGMGLLEFLIENLNPFDKHFMVLKEK